MSRKTKLVVALALVALAYVFLNGENEPVEVEVEE